MSERAKLPSQGWRDEVFKSPPRRDIDKKSKTTTRIPVWTESGQMYAEGGNEATALRLLRHLQLLGLVRRFKAQPFCLEEIGGPTGRVPDILVELNHERSLHVVQVKAKRFITDDVQSRFDQEREFLARLGFHFHVWTNRDRLGQPTSMTVQMLDRGYRCPPSDARLNEIGAAAKEATTLAPLLLSFGWDDVIAAAAHCLFHIDCTEEIHENTPVQRVCKILCKRTIESGSEPHSLSKQ
jgi:hypothetical protein